jgi:hypothetical protein
MAKEIKSALEHAQQKLSGLLAERQKVDKQIMDWKRVIDSLSVVSEGIDTSIPPNLELPANFSEKPSLGFTDAIRAIVGKSQAGVTPTEVRDQLREIGFDLTKYKQEMVPVHNTLKRLEEQEEIYSVDTQPNHTVYWRIDPVAKALALDPNPPSLASLVRAGKPKMPKVRGRLNQDRLSGRYNKPRFRDPPVTEDT